MVNKEARIASALHWKWACIGCVLANVTVAFVGYPNPGWTLWFCCGVAWFNSELIHLGYYKVPTP